MRSKRLTKRLSDIINKENTLVARLFHKASILKQVDAEISELLPAGFAGKAKVANISRKEITIHITSAALLTRLRLQQNQLVQKINQNYTWADIQKVNIKVRPQGQPRTAPPADQPIRSEKIATEISKAADQCHDENLSQSLRRLADHVRQADKDS